MILIMAAMQEEMDALIERANNVERTNFRDIQIVEMTLAQQDVVLAQSGIGKINAAYTTTMLANHFKPQLIINIGSAGGLVDSQRVGDIVIADTVLSHDFDIGENTHEDARFIYYPDLKASTLAKTVASTLGHNVYHGLIVSGDQFVVHGSYAYQRIKKNTPQAICAEMEASAVGAVSSRLNIPFIVIRALSDVQHKDGNELQFDEYLALASQNSALICEEFISHYI